MTKYCGINFNISMKITGIEYEVKRDQIFFKVKLIK